jgi:DNA (cytosine-5)-methyltransferase 1
MLRTLGDAGYAIEWRVVNSAEYGFPQRRIRVFIIAKKVNKNLRVESPYDLITKTGILARALPIITEQLDAIPIEIQQDVQELSRTFNKKLTERSPFLNSGFYFRGIAHTLKTIANPTLRTKFYTLGDVLQDEWEVSDDYFVSPAQLDEWRFLKGAKSIERIHKSSGVTYKYAEGAMSFPDSLDKPSRTILTGEGGTSPSRFKHVINTEKGFRRLTPVELERLSGFPDDWTRFDSFGRELSPTKRAFFMGNALVVGLVESIGKILAQEI